MSESHKDMGAMEVKILDVPGCDFQIIIYRTESGYFSYSKRWIDIYTGSYGALGPACGLYDTAEHAEREARLRTKGLDALSNDDTIH